MINKALCEPFVTNIFFKKTNKMTKKHQLVIGADRIILNEIEDEYIPDAVTNYFEAEVRTKDRIGFFTYDSKSKTSAVICQACGGSFSVSGKLINSGTADASKANKNCSCHWVTYLPKKYSTIFCPHCQKEIETVNAKHCSHYFKRLISQCVYFEKRGDAIVSRKFEYERKYGNRLYAQGKSFSEYQITFFRINTQTVTDYYKDMYLNSWTKRSNGYGESRGAIYEIIQSEKELKEIFADAGYKNHCFPQIAQRMSADGAMLCLYKAAIWKGYESILALGYDTLAIDIAINHNRNKDDKTINLYKSKANEVLGVLHKELVPFGHSSLKEQTIKAIKTIKAFGRYKELTPARLKKIECFLASYNSLGNLDVFRAFGIEKVINYLQKFETKNRDFASIVGDFLDYRNECHKLGYNLNNEGIMFPKDLHKAHSKTTALVRAQNEKSKIDDLNVKLEKYAKFIEAYKKEMRSGNYVVKICSDVFEELNHESEALNHCAHDYKERLFAGVALIYFIRLADKPNKPLYTLEYNVKTGGIVQIRGFGNEPADNDIWDRCLELFKNPFVEKIESEKKVEEDKKADITLATIEELEDIAGRLGGFVKFINGNGYHNAYGVTIEYIPNKIARDPTPWKDGANSVGGGIYYSGINKQKEFEKYGAYAAIIRPTAKAKIAYHNDRMKASEVLCLAVYKVKKTSP